MIYIGLDPGQSGGIACYDTEKSSPWVIKMPDTEGDLFSTLEGIVWFTDHSKNFAVIEKVGPMPKQGVVSTWKFSGNYHGLRMALLALKIPFESVLPRVWQKSMGCLTKGDKNVTKRKAQELFPALKVTHATADALLLMEYCRRTHDGRGASNH